MERSVLAVVEFPGPFCTGRSLQRSKVLSGCFEGVINPNAPGLCAGPLPQVTVATTAVRWGGRRGFQHRTFVLLPLCPLPPGCPTSSGVGPAATAKGIAVPPVAWRPSPSRQDRDLRSAPGVMGHPLNAGVEDPPFRRILPIPLQFPSCSPDFQLLPLFTGSKSSLCFQKKEKFPRRHPRAPSSGLTADSSGCYNNEQQPGQIGQTLPRFPAASKSPPYAQTHSLPPQGFAICLRGGCSTGGAAGPLRPPCASFPLRARPAAPQAGPHAWCRRHLLSHTPSEPKHHCFGP